LTRLAIGVQGDDNQRLLLTHFLSLFVQLGLEGWKLSQNINRFSIKMSESAGNLGVLIPKISALLSRMSQLRPCSAKLRAYFRDFWFYCVTLGFARPSGNWPNEWYNALCEVSTKSPTLTPSENFLTEMIENASLKLTAIIPQVSSSVFFIKFKNSINLDR
jgi:phosphatidylinositol 4-kinase